jgi:hypothetical protein
MIGMPKYEYYDFGLGLDLKENFFLTKVLQKYRLLRTRYESPAVYVSQADKKRFLGDPTFKKRMAHFLEALILQEIPMGVNPKNPRQFLYGYIPSPELKYSRQKAYIPFLDDYYDRIFQLLSTEAKYIYQTLKKTQIVISHDDFQKELLNSFHRHGYSDFDHYLLHNEGIWETIKDFNTVPLPNIIEDKFGHRVHTLISQIHKEIRKDYVFINHNPINDLDLHQSQMVILGKLLFDLVGNNSFSKLVKENDIYNYFGSKNGITDRTKAKKLMFRALFDRNFSQASLMLKEAFPDSFKIIENLKSITLGENPSWKRYSNLAFMLQREESGIFRNIWSKLGVEKIPFLTAHDSIMVEKQNTSKVKFIMENILKNQIGNHIIISAS